MDINLLVDEILARVSVKMKEIDLGKDTANDKPKILVLTERHGTVCHEFLETSNLKKNYIIECALLKEYNCELNDYEAVIMYNLSIDALCKLASGICDTPYISFASRAILLGKKIFIPTEEIELFQYKQSAPSAYYSMMNEKLNLLRNSGVIICRQDELEKSLEKGLSNQEKFFEACKLEECKLDECKSTIEIKSVKLCKKVITERDIRDLSTEGVTRICINNNSILTDLAKDYIHERKIVIERESSPERKIGKSL